MPSVSPAVAALRELLPGTVGALVQRNTLLAATRRQGEAGRQHEGDRDRGNKLFRHALPPLNLIDRVGIDYIWAQHGQLAATLHYGKHARPGRRVCAFLNVQLTPGRSATDTERSPFDVGRCRSWCGAARSRGDNRDPADCCRSVRRRVRRKIPRSTAPVRGTGRSGLRWR
jgi:hypothetical protein